MESDMIVGALVATIAVPVVVLVVTVSVFGRAVEKILARIVGAEMSKTWAMLVIFGMYVAGISYGFPLFAFGKFLSEPMLEFDTVYGSELDAWIWVGFQAAVRTVQGVGLVLAGFFVVALLAYAIVAGLESRRKGSEAA
jgi:hypothetical protein